MPGQLCPRCMHPHDFDPSWNDELWDLWCRADRRMAEVEKRLKDVGLLRSRKPVSKSLETRVTDLETSIERLADKVTVLLLERDAQRLEATKTDFKATIVPTNFFNKVTEELCRSTLPPDLKAALVGFCELELVLAKNNLLGETTHSSRAIRDFFLSLAEKP